MHVHTENKEADLLLTEGCMAGCYSLALDVGERVQHAVVRVHRGQSVLG